MDLDVVSLISEIPEEVTKLPSKKYSNKILNTNIFNHKNFNEPEMLKPEITILEEDSGFSSEGSWDEDFLDLFPSLASV